MERIKWPTTNKEIMNDSDSCYSYMRGLDLMYAVGKHEANPVNFFPPAGVQTWTN